MSGMLEPRLFIGGAYHFSWHVVDPNVLEVQWAGLSYWRFHIPQYALKQSVVCEPMLYATSDILPGVHTIYLQELTELTPPMLAAIGKALQRGPEKVL